MKSLFPTLAVAAAALFGERVAVTVAPEALQSSSWKRGATQLVGAAAGVWIALKVFR